MNTYVDALGYLAMHGGLLCALIAAVLVLIFVILVMLHDDRIRPTAPAGAPDVAIGRAAVVYPRHRGQHRRHVAPVRHAGTRDRISR